MKLVKVNKISYYSPAKAYKVLLIEEKSSNEFCVIVGTMEAQSIAMAIEKIKLPRPMTHDLIYNILEKFNCKVHKIEIKGSHNGTYFASIILRYPDNKLLEIDSRPSDAIVIALKTSANIYVCDNLINSQERNSFQPKIQKRSVEKKSIQSDYKALENLENALKKAIIDEEYEVAAKLRDRIDYIKKDTLF
ncbi:MAG: hypothetical protein CMF80_05655 [Candidatus Marinimicrobia bacterium]|nr:hypothetical protein [Candidatus Neomarinimicrobiota bacterium]